MCASLSMPCCSLSFCLARLSAVRVFHSFPTRRSSDLVREDNRCAFDARQARAHPGRGGVHPPQRVAGGGRDTLRWVHTATADRKSTRLNSSHTVISYAVFCLKKKKQKAQAEQNSSRHD